MRLIDKARADGVLKPLSVKGAVFWDVLKQDVLLALNGSQLFRLLPEVFKWR
ncbi:protein of unknown function [Methylocaldum szegediense]|uniref:Uncharacterized protein n=1 Tax=Methylocaldum szegediense TaxID=73780 RepID=A0ABM9I3H2_9GAMM|nr:protein of unknown function [Methylocaldum szegediense]